MANNEILPFAGTDNGTNLLTQAEYNADSQRPIGNQPGVARSKLVNKVLRQTSLIAAAIAQIGANNQASDVVDSLTVSQLATILENAIKAVAGKGDYKDSCRLATTANIASLTGLLVIDGVQTVAGDRVLVKGQTAGSQNGIYVVAAGAWTRAADFDQDAEVTAGAVMPVEAGTANGDSLWMLTTDNPIIVGTTALVFAMVSGNVGTPGTYNQVTVDARGRVVSGVTNAIGGKLLRITRYTTAGSGTWTKQADTNSILVRAVAGGGGGGGGSSTGNIGGNGGYSGCYGEKLITAPASSYTYTVGAAGGGGAVNGSGSAGGQTAFGTSTLTGGPGGAVGLGGLVALPTGSGWDFTSASPGGPGKADSTANTHAAPGVGGASPFAGGGSGSGTTTLAGNYGSGGGGGPRTSGTAYAGSAGGAGYIEVWEFA